MDDAAYMQAWRAATQQRFGAFLDARYARYKQFYTILKPDPTRPIVEQALHTVLDDMFDEKHYPQGMSFDAVMARADAEFAPQLTALLEPLWKETMLEGKYNHRKNARSSTGTSVGHECYTSSARLVDSMREAGQALSVEQDIRTRLPMGTEGLRAACAEAGHAQIDVTLQQLAPYYTISDDARTTLHDALAGMLDAAFKDPGANERRPLVMHVLNEDFTCPLAEACAAKNVTLAPRRAWIAPKELSPVFARKHVQREVRLALADRINQAFREAAPKEDITPQTTLEHGAIAHVGTIDYRKVHYMNGHDTYSRELAVRDRIDMLVAGDKRMEPLRDDILKAIKAAEPPRKLKYAGDYFKWLEKQSVGLLNEKLAEIPDLAKAERDLLCDVHQAALPEMLRRAQSCADHIAELMQRHGRDIER